jgi:hypothetical protein
MVRFEARNRDLRANCFQSDASPQSQATFTEMEELFENLASLRSAIGIME